MPWLLAILALLAVMYLPSWWVKRIMSRYARPEDRYDGSGAELANHLVAQLGLDGVVVTRTSQGDHYDPAAREVRLSESVHDGRSLMAVTVAAHEVGHAIQHADGYGALNLRTRLAGWLQPLSRVAPGLMLLGPILGLLTRSPQIAVLSVAAGVAFVLSMAVFHLATLPVELDASFARAMPVLKRYLKPEDVPHARRILKAAALTYVAQTLVSLLTVWRWLRLP